MQSVVGVEMERNSFHIKVVVVVLKLCNENFLISFYKLAPFNYPPHIFV